MLTFTSGRRDYRTANFTIRRPRLKKPNYKFEKQKKDKDKSRKQEIKRQKKLARAGHAPQRLPPRDDEGQGPPPDLS